MTDEDVNRRLARIADAAVAFSVWRATPVEGTPTIELGDWRVMQLISGPSSGARHLVGTNLTEREPGRVTSRIVDVDRTTATCRTESGRLYKLIGVPGRTEDGDWVWRVWLQNMDNPAWTDATHEFLADMERR